MSKDRNDHHHRRRSQFVAFTGYETSTNFQEQTDPIEVRVHLREIVLRNRVRKDATPEEGDWYCFQVIAGGTKYYIDERTFRRLLSCVSFSS